MDRSSDELCASVVAHELVIDAVRSVVEKGELPPADEEHVILCLYPTSIGSNEIEFVCRDVEDKLSVVSEPPGKRNIPALRGLVEKELIQMFSFIEKLDSAAGFAEKANHLTEHDILTKVAQIQETSTDLVAEREKLHKRSKIMSQLFKESLDPVVNSASALKSELLDNVSQISQLESSILSEKYKDVPNDVLERLANDLEEVIAGDLENGGAEEPELGEDLAAAASKLNQINEEIVLKKALLEVFFSDRS